MATSFEAGRLAAIPTGTRLVVEHWGFTGVGEFMLAKFVMTPGWGKTVSALAAMLGEVE